ncbi:MAG: Hsp70 family protein [Selenomonadaceae bacterium]|nr:Hsp70 family protein [Selenomonadaceae bacterium]
MGKEIGIDLGTTNTVVSYTNIKGKLRQLRYESKEIIPSVIYFRSQSEYLIGEKAQKYLAENPNAGMANFKLNIGNNDRIEIFSEDGQTLKKRPREIAQLFLNKIVLGLENKLLKEFGAVDGCIDRAVITVPANFSSTEKGNTRTAARAAGLTDVKLAAEPTAAAIAYEDSQGDENSDSVILVYDFGGGTFDVSVIRRNKGAFEEITTGGDKHLGGNNLTNILAEKILNRINEDYGVEFPFDEDDFDEDEHGISSTDYKRNMSEIWRTANLIKEELSENENFSANFNIILPDGINRLVEVDFSREELENYIKNDIEKTVDITVQTIQRAKDEKGIEKIDQIVLAGGSSNIPLVKKTLEDRLQNQDIVFCDDVSTLISRGAAVLAKRYTEMESLSKAVTTVQMGVLATEGVQFGKFQPIISEDEPLPCSRKKIFYLSKDNLQKFEIKYYERDIKNYPNAIFSRDPGIEEIDSIIIENLPPNLKTADVKVEVEFNAKKDGSLDINVELKDTNGNKIQSENMRVEKRSDLE